MFLRRHEDRHQRPFACPFHTCENKTFADKGGLQRHKREKHNPSQFFCPVTECERHRHGFGRKYNLIEHEKRVHGGVCSDQVASALDGVSSASSLQFEDLRQQSENGDVGRNFPEENQAQLLSRDTSDAMLDDPEKLKKRLKMLREERGSCRGHW